MNYIKKTAYGIEISKRNTITTNPKGLVQYLNQLCIHELTTLEGRLQAIKKKYDKKYNTPIYINASCCFFYLEPLRNIEALVINLKTVKTITKLALNKTQITFIDGSILHVMFDEAHVLKRFRQAYELLELIEASN
ncbi:MAG: competence protein ComK [Candidatus Izemoplasmataceae bacterium]